MHAEVESNLIAVVTYQNSVRCFLRKFYFEMIIRFGFFEVLRPKREKGKSKTFDASSLISR